MFYLKLGKKPGLIFLIIILSIITIGIIKPQFYLLGWDNFSSYLNLKSSLFNTFFATWREHRGLGVPSDAEVNDLFRQIFSFVASLFVPKNLVDQLYFVLMLWGGVLGMYKLGKYIAKKELSGFLASFFYLFNLSTLAVFYFPMIMYVTRFFMLPTTIYILLRLINDSSFSKRTLLLYLFILFIGFGAFMVPTIFIVFMIMLLLMLLIFKNKKRVLLVLGFYLLLNLFWILPFANYTLQKGAVVTEAPLFIDINEAMLNKPKSYFSFENQVKLRPSFFDSQFTNNTNSENQPFHPLAITNPLLWIFPVIYLLGIAYIFLFKRERLYLWFAATALTFLLLSFKEYSPLGFLYSFISDHLPFANTVFRFGDTKFHAMIAFSGAIVSAFFITELISFRRGGTRRGFKFITYLILTGLIFFHLFIYKTYFNGNFVGFFMYNKIPSAYFEMADIINRDPQDLRVIQLPLDNRSYWKPYTWGYFGSAFLHFMLNKPLFDRTFEPASMEGAAVDQQILDTLNLASLVPSEELLSGRALELYRLLQSLSVKYIIDDGTISTNIDSRNIAYWGKINPADSARLLSFLENKGQLKLVKEFEITPQDYQNFAKDYAKLYPYNKEQTLEKYSARKIRLYELVNPQPRFQFISVVDKVHSSSDLLLPTGVRNSLTVNYLQAEKYDHQSLIFPFTQNGLNFPAKLNAGQYVLESKENSETSQAFLLNVYLQKNGDFLKVYLESPVWPEVEGATAKNPKNYQVINLPIERPDFEYLIFGENVLPVNNNLSEGIILSLGSVMVHELSVPVGLLYPESSYNLSDNLTQLESNPQCLNDALEEAKSEITGEGGTLKISGQNVSNCLTTAVNLNQDVPGSQAFTRLEFTVSGKNQSLQTEKKGLDSGKEKLFAVVNALPNPLMMHVCVKLNDSSVCVNDNNLFKVTEEKKQYAIPLVGDLTNISKLLVTFTVRNSQRQKYETETTNIVLKTYSTGISDAFPVSLQKDYANQLEIGKLSNLNLSLPLTKSSYTQTIDLKKDGMLIGRDPTCDLNGKFQAVKEDNNGLLLYAVGCKNFLNQNIPFLSSNFYLWTVSYKHLSGNLPVLILMDKINTYAYQKLIPLNIKPDSYFSLPLERPESFFTTKKAISEKLAKTPAYLVKGFIEPQPDLLDNKNKELIIDNFSQNEGVSAVSNLTLTELPGFWSNIRVRPLDYQVNTYEIQAAVSLTRRILPSFWQIKINAEKEGNYLALFNEQYDQQWIVLNAKTLLHARCNGVANCYEVRLAKGQSTLYLLYKPALLAFVGFLITLGTVLKLIVRKPKN